MTILAIDPGPIESAWVLWNGEVIGSHGKQSNTEIASWISSAQIATADRLAIEMIASYGMPVGAEVFETCVWIGRFMQSFGDTRRVDRLTRNEVKNHLCHSSRAKDSNIRQAIIDRLGPVGTKKAPGPCYGLAGDEWAALAVALTWWDKEKA